MQVLLYSDFKVCVSVCVCSNIPYLQYHGLVCDTVKPVISGHL